MKTVLFAARDMDSIALLTRAVAHVYRAPLPALSRTEAGKPFFPTAPQWHFSLSHSGRYALCALSEHPVGADIEVVRPRRALLPARVMTEAEQASWDGSWHGFYKVWTAKEAAGKYQGTGLRLPLCTMAVPEGTRIVHYSGEDWVAAVCCEDTPAETIFWFD